MSVFLDAAKKILTEQGKPLTSLEITIQSLQQGLLPHTGKTPQNTMRARLSDDLRKHGAISVFQRTGKNRFALREWKLKEYIAPAFLKDIQSEKVICYPSLNPLFQNNSINGIFDYNQTWNQLLKQRSGITILPRKEAESKLIFKQLVSYVILRSKDGKVLTYMRGKYSNAHKTLLIGRQSLGFGGHVLDVDIADIFSLNDSGIENAAKREVSEELKGYEPTNCRPIKIIQDCTSVEGYKHLGVVMESFLPKNFNYTHYKKELSINGIQLRSPKQLWEDFHLFEYWSQLIIKDLFSSSRPTCISSISPRVVPKHSKNLVLVGEIATGKTSILTALSGRHNFHYVSARACLVDLLGIPDFKQGNRAIFQEKAQALISQKDGPGLLARKIASQVSTDRITLIDGIRNIATIKELKKILGECIIVYIDAPRDQALRHFLNRSNQNISSSEFVRARDHATEKDLPLILQETDAILYNADSLEVTINLFSNWIRKTYQT